MTLCPGKHQPSVVVQVTPYHLPRLPKEPLHVPGESDPKMQLLG